MYSQQAPGAISKAISLLVELESAGRAMRLSELSMHTGLAKSTTHRLLGALAESGMVDRVGSHYEASRNRQTNPTPSDPRGQALRKFAPFLGDVLVRTGLTASLAILKGTDVVFTHRVYGHGGTWTPSDDTGRAPAATTAAGRLLLAYDAAAVGRLLDGSGPDSVRLADLDPHLQRIRRQRCSIKVGTGTTCIAVPLDRDDNVADIALTVKGRTQDLDQQRVLAQLRFVAHLAVSQLQCPTKHAR